MIGSFLSAGPNPQLPYSEAIVAQSPCNASGSHDIVSGEDHEGTAEGLWAIDPVRSIMSFIYTLSQSGRGHTEGGPKA